MNVPEWVVVLLATTILSVAGWAISKAVGRFLALEDRLDQKAQSIDRRATSVDQSIREAIKPDLDSMHEELKIVRKRLHHTIGIVQYLAAKADIDPGDFSSKTDDEE